MNKSYAPAATIVITRRDVARIRLLQHINRFVFRRPEEVMAMVCSKWALCFPSDRHRGVGSSDHLEGDLSC